MDIETSRLGKALGGIETWVRAGAKTTGCNNVA